MSTANALGHLKRFHWKLMTTEDAGLLPDGRLLRYVDDISHKEIDSHVAFCERYVDEKNHATSATPYYAFVTDPMVDGKVKSGKWRHVRTFVQRYDERGNENPQGTNWRIVQELAEGYLTALDYVEARLLGVQTTPGDGSVNATTERFITLEWRGVDPDTMQALTTAKAGTAVVNDLKHRKIGKSGATTTVDISGDWHPLVSTAVLEADGSGTVRWIVGDPEFILTAFSSWQGAGQSSRIYVWNVPEALAQAVVEGYKALGKDCTLSRDEQRGLIDIVVDGYDFVKVDTGWITYTSEDGTVGRRTVLNLPTADLAAFITDLEGRTSGNQTSFDITPAAGNPGYYNVVATYRPQNATWRLSSGNWAALTSYTYTFPARVLANGQQRKATKVRESFHSTRSNAESGFATVITAGHVLIESFGKFASGIDYMGENRWKAVRIEEAP